MITEQEVQDTIAAVRALQAKAEKFDRLMAELDKLSTRFVGGDVKNLSFAALLDDPTEKRWLEGKAQAFAAAATAVMAIEEKFA